jgi:hypothetical protein
LEIHDMKNISLTRIVSATLVASLLNFAMLQSVGAAAIDTETAVAVEDRAVIAERIDGRLAREDVRQALQSLGVDPAQARARVDALTDAEIVQLDGKLAQLPAAGDGGWFLLVIVLGVLIWLFASGKLKYS